MIHALLLALAAHGAADDAPRGVYVEARTAAVFAGACHYGGQWTTAGREAALVWRVEAGAHAGVDLAGAEVAAVVAADRNLADPAAARRSVVLVDAALPPARRDAAVAWLRAAHGDVLGRVVGVEALPLRVDVDPEGGAFAADAGERLALRGVAMPERECCRMPYAVWYEPEVPLAGRRVGRVDALSVDAREPLGRAWARAGENDAFLGRFGPAE